MTHQIVYIPHGGGPLPLLGDPDQQPLANFLSELGRQLQVPDIIIMLSAHWETPQVSISSGEQPALIYDYYGFPPESYQIEYPAPGAPQVAEELAGLFTDHGIKSSLKAGRGFDHGMFVPLKLMYPEANIPCIQLSLLEDLSPEKHLKMGEVLAQYQQKKILVVGSGMSFHNLSLIRRPITPEQVAQGETFSQWLIETLTDPSLADDTRAQALCQWAEAPEARFCHPREEHLIPLHVCAGMAFKLGFKAKLIFNETIFGFKVQSFLFSDS